MVREWQKKGYVGQDFADYVNDENVISFPWSMIDKITPRPADSVAAALEQAGVEQMKVHHRMQQHRPAVALAPRGPADDTSGGIDHRKQLFPIIRAFHFPTIFYEFYSDRKDCNRRRT